MPWTMNDYPSSLKNLDKPVKKKAIDIANSMLDDGYDEGRAIPIATEQAKEWYSNASKEEVTEFMEEEDPKSRDEEESSSDPELMEKAELVEAHEDGWAVRAKSAKKPDVVYDSKSEAIERAKEVAEKKGTEAIIYKKDGTVEKRHSY
ncbi:DUF2188 domain-containing protein [uncultured Marinococcus sp.]|uniref:DUF2188 domain-containing protein n=1 Tax=uncultured Marinococcus sp. TaxID=487012 RepID=UPI002619B0AA|nr:DUF2188 domain-containing protein [uncultured Marinococcus sp.]